MLVMYIYFYSADYDDDDTINRKLLYVLQNYFYLVSIAGVRNSSSRVYAHPVHLLTHYWAASALSS